MWRTNQLMNSATLLAHALPGAEQHEAHHRLVNAPIEAVWDALTRLSASDLPLSRVLMRIRHAGDTPGSKPLLTSGPVPAEHLDAPRYAVGVKAHRPWSGLSGPPLHLDSAGSCPPGWVVTGTEFELFPVCAGRTLLTTQTRCRATDPDTRRAMRRYWMFIGPFSGLIRRELLRAVARRAEEAMP